MFWKADWPSGGEIPRTRKGIGFLVHSSLGLGDGRGSPQGPLGKLRVLGPGLSDPAPQV